MSGTSEVDVPDPRAYEEACITQVRGRLKSIESDVSHLGRALHGAILTGAYPETTIVIEWDEHGQPRRSELPIWTDDLKGPTGRALHPEVVAVLATVDLEEP